MNNTSLKLGMLQIKTFQLLPLVVLQNSVAGACGLFNITSVQKHPTKCNIPNSRDPKRIFQLRD